jgi:endonuclease YncB( thermonuclease family)
LYGVDCPEKKQDFGQRAKQFTSERVFGKTVDVRVVSVDRYGRTVGDVILPGGQRLSEELVGAGYAWWYSRYAPKDGRLSQLEAKARREKKGLWSIPEPVPPWEFRRPRAAARR